MSIVTDINTTEADLINTANLVQPTLSYTLNMDEPHTHYIEVVMDIKNLNQDYIDIKMAAWTPGSYMIREFARNVEGFAASANSKEVLSNKISKNTWRVRTKNTKNVSVRYRVYAYEMSVRTSFVDADHAVINPASVMMFIDGMLDVPATIKINPYKDWKEISTALKPAKKGDKWTLQSPNFDMLADSPIEIGNHKIIDFKAVGIPHQLCLIGESNCNEEKIVTDIQKIAQACTDVFGENPLESYTILQHNTDGSYGGLEHFNSTSLMYPRWNFEPEGKYFRWLGLMCHEYFHLWNIKRIRPKELGPFDYENENYTTLLWVAEGVTSYYDDYLLRRADLATPEKYLSVVASNINTYENKPGKKVQSLTESSFDAWIKYYRSDENSNNCCVSYYTKGAVIAAMLDLEILHATKGKKSLDEVMRFLYTEYYKKEARGITQEEFQTVCEDIAGVDMDAFFKAYVHGTAEVDYNKHLAHVGLKIVDENTDKQTLSLGARLQDNDGKISIRSIKRGTCGYNDGLNVYDEVIAINGFRIRKTADVTQQLSRKKAGDVVEVMVSRGGKIRTFEVNLERDNTIAYKIEKADKISKAQEALYNHWMRLD